MEKSYNLCNFEYPTKELIPQDFMSLTEIAKQEWEVEMFGFKWFMVRLDEYENRILTRRTANYDLMTKGYLERVDILNRAIVRTIRITDNKIFDFYSEDEKISLRHLLLSIDPLLITELYEAYTAGSMQIEEQFRKQFPNIRDQFKKGFFVSPSGSSKPSDSKTPKTEDSSK